MKKISLLLAIVFSCLMAIAQTDAIITVGGDADKFYPVIFADAGWVHNEETEVSIGRSSTHWSGLWKGSEIAKFRYHASNWGNGSSFLDATIYSSADFFAGWADATASNAASQIVIWLKGGNVDYQLRCKWTLTVAVYDGVANALPYVEPGGPSRTYKTTVDDYVQSNGSSFTGNSIVRGDATILGSLEIGTTVAHPEKLSVNGKIRAREIKVEVAGWPDYVFEDGFKVERLEELERYIKSNKHLPEMPSAKDAEANGIALGEMNKLLLKKVEELTLHLIEKDKEVRTLKNENKSTLKILTDLATRIAKLENK